MFNFFCEFKGIPDKRKKYMVGTIDKIMATRFSSAIFLIQREIFAINRFMKINLIFKTNLYTCSPSIYMYQKFSPI